MPDNNGNSMLTPHDGARARENDGSAKPDLAAAASAEAAPALSRRAATALPSDLAGILRMVHRSLRGRYAVTVALMIACATAGGMAGWKLGRPVYRSEGLLRIAYSLPEVMQETDQNKPLAQFDAFMLSQRLLITSRRVIDMAIDDPIWQSMGLAKPQRPDRYFAEHLNVETKPRSEYLLLQVSDDDPRLAAAGVKAVINAYSELYSGEESRLEQQRSGVLVKRQAALRSQIDQLTSELRDGSQQYGTSKLDGFYDAAAERVMRLEAALADVRVAIATGSPADPTTSSSAHDPAAPKVDVTPLELASRDPEMRERLSERSGREDEVRRLGVGLSSAHPQMKAARAALDAAAARVEQYLAERRDVPLVGGADAGGANAHKLVQELRADEQRLALLLQSATEEMRLLGRKRLALQEAQSQLAALSEESEHLVKRSDVLRAESALGGRLSVISSGEIPLSPVHDPRIKLLLASAFGGAFLPFGLLVAAGILRRPYQHSDEIDTDITPVIPLLGILPDLDGIPAGAERWAGAGHSVHQIRMLLSTRAPKGRCASYLITSATACEGKTSLTMGLGLSFAASGLRTLVIDCDLVGRRITRALGADTAAGLGDALDFGDLRGHLRRVATHLYVLPSGHAHSAQASTLGAAKIATLFAEARRHFDVVLVDTGPILGSLESVMIAPEVDGSIFVVSRGRERRVVQTAMRRLESLGVRMAGFVYNRAHPRDFDRSPYGSSSYSSSSLSSPASLPAPTRHDAAKPRLPVEQFGALVAAVECGVAA
jgi:Mrp family chromosome partitioning ATPase/uncharacterized protein involved in exopolysaccharide biosynthesis